MLEQDSSTANAPGFVLYEWLEKTLAGLGYELVDLERSGRGPLLRIFIDKPEGINIDDCAEVSRHLNHALSAANVDYDRLEISSPGMDRPLKKASDFERFKGALVKVKLRGLVNGRRTLQGTLHDYAEGIIHIQADEQILPVSLQDVDKIRLVPAFD